MYTYSVFEARFSPFSRSIDSCSVSGRLRSRVSGSISDASQLAVHNEMVSTTGTHEYWVSFWNTFFQSKIFNEFCHLT